MAFPNPFARDTEGRRRNIAAYKVLTLLSWLLQFVATIYLSTYRDHHHGPIWKYPGFVPRSAFTLNHVFVEVFWVVLYIMQIVYIWHLFSNKDHLVNSAASVGSHFILYNLLHFVWVFLWAYRHWVIAEIVLIINFLNLISLYLRHATSPRLIHLATTVMPLTFTFFMIYWNGAIMVHVHNLATRIVANVFIWGQLVYAGFFLLAFKDYYVGFATSYLAFALAVAQLPEKAIALQWPFAFAIGGLTFIASSFVAAPEVFGARDGSTRAGERAPLLQEDA